MNGGSIVGDTAVNDNRWHHVVAVMSGSNVNTITLYVDGVAVGNSSGPSNRTVATASGIDVRIGTDHSSRHFRGFMDDVRIYSAALTATEVASVYGDGLGDFGYAGPIISGPAGVAGSSGSYTVDFKTNGTASNVTGFTASDIDVTGGAVSNFTAVSGSQVHLYGYRSDSSFGCHHPCLTEQQLIPMVVVLLPIYLLLILQVVRKPKALVAWWKMDEGTGTSTSGGLVPDSSWSPTSLPDLKLWLDASDSSTITGNPVTAWADKSGNNITLTSSSGPASGTRNLNGKNVLDFDGTKTIEVQNGLDLGTGGPAIQVVTVLISDAYASNHAYGYSSGNPTGGQAFSMSMNESGNKFTGRHWDGYTRFEGSSYTTGQGYVLSHSLEAGATYLETQIVQNGLTGIVLHQSPHQWFNV